MSRCTAAPGGERASFALAGLAVLGVLASCMAALEVAMVAVPGLALVGGLLLASAVTVVLQVGTGPTPLHVAYLTAIGELREGKVVGWAPGDRNLVSGSQSVVVADLDGRPLAQRSQVDATQLPSDLYPDVQATMSDDAVTSPQSVTSTATPPARTIWFWVDRWGIVNPLPAPTVSGVDLRTTGVAVPLLAYLVAYAVVALQILALVRTDRAVRRTLSPTEPNGPPEARG